jgi:hypothetical protein
MGKLEWLGGIDSRTPMDYNRYDWKTGKEFQPLRPLEHTYETIHPSVRLRMGTPGKDLENSGDYVPEGLDGWKIIGTTEVPASGTVNIKQIQEGQKNIQWLNGNKVIPEEIISEIEYDLLKSFAPSIEQKFLSIVPK